MIKEQIVEIVSLRELIDTIRVVYNLGGDRVRATRMRVEESRQ